MNYLKSLKLVREPFANTPDPDFFYHSSQHLGCLQKLEISIRLRRGLNVVIGDVGSGKTTLCRHMIRNFASDRVLETHLVLDPSFDTPQDFLKHIAQDLTGGDYRSTRLTEWQLKEEIKNNLFGKGVDEDKIVILIIDEGQKIPFFCLEILREFLNYETNHVKLLQIVIFAQKEFELILQRLPNVADRINLYHLLEPLTFNDTRKMIQFRLDQCREPGQGSPLFTTPALWAIFRTSGGYPRKIINLCHLTLLSAIIQNRSRVDWFLVKACSGGDVAARKTHRLRFSTLLLSILIFIFAALLGSFTPVGEWFKKKVYVTESAPVSPSKSMDIPVVPRIIKPLTRESFNADVPEPENSKIPAPETHANSTLPLKSETVNESSNDGILKNTLDIRSLATEPDSRFEGMPPLAPLPRVLPEPILSPDDREENGMPTPVEDITQLPKAVEPAATEPEINAGTGVLNEKPTILGELSLQRGEYVAQLIRIIYGSSELRFYSELKEVNPQIEDLSMVEIGQKVRFPLKVAVPAPQTNMKWRIQLSTTDSLRKAVDEYRKFSQFRLIPTIAPYWSNREGLTFAVILNESFVDSAGAQLRKEQLPQPWNRIAVLTNLWSEDRIYYSEIFRQQILWLFEENRAEKS